MQDLCELLRTNSYPGRGIVVGHNRVYYWIMGRSVNSRNRVFTLTGDGIKTEAYDPSKLEDPSLIIYHPVRTMDDDLVVTNGNQTDTIVEKKDFVAGCQAHRFEPDAPNFTPRISSILHSDSSFAISILKHQAGEADRCERQFFFYEGVDAGEGYFISTYQHDGDPLPSFAGEPIHIRIGEPKEVWEALDQDNKVSLYTNVDGNVTLFNARTGD